MPLITFKIEKAPQIDILSIRFANTFVDLSDEDVVTITTTSIESKIPVDAPTTNPVLLVNIRANGAMEGLQWTFNITINGVHKTPLAEKVTVDENGRADFKKGF